MGISSQAKVKTEIVNVELLPCSLGIQDLLLSTTIALFNALALRAQHSVTVLCWRGGEYASGGVMCKLLHKRV